MARAADEDDEENADMERDGECNACAGGGGEGVGSEGSGSEGSGSDGGRPSAGDLPSASQPLTPLPPPPPLPSANASGSLVDDESEARGEARICVSKLVISGDATMVCVACGEADGGRRSTGGAPPTPTGARFN